MKNPSDQDLNQNQNQNQPRQVTTVVNRGTRFSGNPTAPMRQQVGNQAPVPKNAETAAAAVKIGEFFRRSVGKK